MTPASAHPGTANPLCTPMRTWTSTMNDTDDFPPLIALPTDLDDTAAAKLRAFFLEAARVLETHYAVQLERYHHPPDDRQLPLWVDDPPF